ncbi:MAG: transglutaminase domain-containing protein [Kofleriaceae bacterium]
MASRGVRVAGLVLKTSLRVVWVSTMVLTPLFGFWLASSLAAYSNASQWLALLVGLLLFPILPVGWDLLFLWRRKRKGIEGAPVRAILTRIDRLVLRTLLINGLFLGAMLWRAPETAFRAIAVRGDWMLDGHDGPIANAIRSRLLGFADRFEQRWHSDEDLHGKSDAAPPELREREHDGTKPPEITYKPGQPHPDWPMSPDPDIQVTEMPDDVQTSPEAVGKYLAARIPDQKRLAKALHDYVVLRLTYDEATFQLRGEERYTKRPSQKAEDVFVARTAVCEGYARLLVALGEAAGIETAYLTGYIRTSERRIDDAASEEAVKSVLEGYLHAWNAMKIDGQWLLVDATWDDPMGNEKDSIESTYLFTPPTLFRMDHLPEEDAWQLAPPISAGEFARQPLLSPYVGELGIVLESPTRSQITVDGDVQILLDNPYGAKITALAQRAGTTSRDVRCTVEPASGTKLAVDCPLDAGQYEVLMFGAPKDSTTSSLQYFGTILVNSR